MGYVCTGQLAGHASRSGIPASKDAQTHVHIPEDRSVRAEEST